MEKTFVSRGLDVLMPARNSAHRCLFFDLAPPTTSSLAVQLFALRGCPLLWSRIAYFVSVVADTAVSSSPISYLIPTSNPLETRCRVCSRDQSRSGF